MHTTSIQHWSHDHTFGQDKPRPGERRTLMVVVITAVMMVIEIAAGIVFGSMALLADGLHMASHASALTISVFAYYYTRRHASDSRFNFGTGKINSLAAFASAVLLAVFALMMAWRSMERLLKPVEIEFNQSILVATIGLIVNAICLFILKGPSQRHPHDGHAHHDNCEQADHHHISGDHNLLSAYIHVLADALTSVLAIVALVAGKYAGAVSLDPFMGVLGAILITRWGWGLIRSSSRMLLDMQAPAHIGQTIRSSVESGSDDRVSDLHVWSVGPDIYAAEISLVSSSPQEVDYYRNRLPDKLSLVHVTIEVKRCGT